MSTENIEVVVPFENNLERIDCFLSNLPEIDFSRSYLQKLIKNEDIIVNENKIKQNYKVKTDDIINIHIPEPTKLVLEPQDIPINIVYEDKSIVVINKTPGLVVHPGPGNWDKTLVNALLYHIKDLSHVGGVERPGIVHRLDKDTSGLMIIAKNDISHRKLIDIFANREIHKEYTTIICGKPKQNHFIIEKPISRHPKYRHKMTIIDNGKEAKTEVFLKKMWKIHMGVFSLLKIKLHTGRTHQIRVHLSSESLPIVGDPIYSKKWQKYKVPYLMLAATKLAFKHPETNEDLEFNIELPEHMNKFVDKLTKLENL